MNCQPARGSLGLQRGSLFANPLGLADYSPRACPIARCFCWTCGSSPSWFWRWWPISWAITWARARSGRSCCRRRKRRRAPLRGPLRPTLKPTQRKRLTMTYKIQGGFQSFA